MMDVKYTDAIQEVQLDSNASLLDVLDEFSRVVRDLSDNDDPHDVPVVLHAYVEYTSEQFADRYVREKKQDLEESWGTESNVD